METNLYGNFKKLLDTLAKQFDILFLNGQPDPTSGALFMQTFLQLQGLANRIWLDLTLPQDPENEREGVLRELERRDRLIQGLRQEIQGLQEIIIQEKDRSLQQALRREEALAARIAALEALTVAAPVEEVRLADEPVADEFIADIPVADIPVADEPVADEPVADEPVVDLPVAEEPAVEEVAVEEPEVEEYEELVEEDLPQVEEPAFAPEIEPEPAFEPEPEAVPEPAPEPEAEPEVESEPFADDAWFFQLDEPLKPQVVNRPEAPAFSDVFDLSPEAEAEEGAESAPEAKVHTPKPEPQIPVPSWIRERKAPKRGKEKEPAPSFLGDLFQSAGQRVVDLLSTGGKRESLEKTISLNDSFLFQRELFGKDSGLYKVTLMDLNEIEDPQEVADYLSSHFPHWDWESQPVQRFVHLVNQRLQHQA